MEVLFQYYGGTEALSLLISKNIDILEDGTSLFKPWN